MSRAEEIKRIKKNGKLIAICDNWQYWALNGILYSINSNGADYSIWCSIKEMNRHLHRLMQITGQKYFTENKDMILIDRKFLSDFAYA